MSSTAVSVRRAASLSRCSRCKRRCLATAAASVAPEAPPPRCEDVAALSGFISSSSRLMVITGAGLSTESGIPDYRSPKGAYTTGFKPMTHAEFLRGDSSRQRYWARSFVGWPRFAHVQPNAAHHALAAMHAAGRLSGGLLTQNVDRLHHRAGTADTLELHGTTHRVVCLSCGAESCRAHMQARLAQLNAGWTPQGGADVALQRPDGDVELAQRAVLDFKVPTCEACGGILKPAVVFFGDSVPPKVSATAKHWAESADALLVIGSSLSTWSSHRLATIVANRKKPIALVNIGPTRADGQASLKIDSALASEVLQRALAHGGLDLPARSVTA